MEEVVQADAIMSDGDEDEGERIKEESEEHRRY
jgi:hypothetical protein